jgi:hypothetical protein
VCFNCIPYEIFTSKLRAYNLSQSACELFYYCRSYYRHRKQRIQFGSFRSKWENVYKKPKNVQINLRSENNMCIPQNKTVTCGTNYYRYTYSAPFYWNKLPNVIRNAPSCTPFKTLLHDWVPSCVCGSCI